MSNIIELLEPKENSELIGFKEISRRLASEGIVLLKNENNVLPLKENTNISIFGRIQFDYYKSGTGSGGLVNVNKVTTILDGLEENPKVNVNKELVNIYLNWVKENPYNAGNGMWASEPWNQIEMPLTDEIVINAKNKSDVAIIIIGRTAGEDRDNWYHEGSYLLSNDEEDMIRKVTSHFDKVVIVLNVGNIIDLSFMDKYPIQGLLMAWHGGMEGGRATSDILCGDVNPSGKLVDSIPFKIEDIPSHKNFGNKDFNLYEEDIYVGYRYFETFNIPTRYSFGFGLSYTNFEINPLNFEYLNSKLHIRCKVKNIGNEKGKEVVQIYIECPQKKINKASKVLIGFSKTKLLKPNEEQIINFEIDEYIYSSYDDAGKTGNKSCYVLEEGQYNIYIGNSINNLVLTSSFNLDNLKVIKKLKEAMSPTKKFKRLTAKIINGKVSKDYEEVPTRSYNLLERINENRPHKIYSKVDKKYRLIDVVNKKISMDEFINQLTNEELACLFRGEGMSSPKVTPGTGAAFGGITPALFDYGFPIACCTDGPSGIRMDSGKRATSIPIGTSLACSFNLDLVEEIGKLLGIEMKNYNIDTLLAPGLNIHRHPFNGRNFEYFSEDPLLTGLIAGAYTKGIQEVGCTCTLKHICCNSQETNRFNVDSIVSERAIREIYLKGFELAIKYSDARILMTSYNPINGIWAASNFDLNTEIIRNEWGFKGILVTDWWAQMNNDQDNASKEFTQFMIRSQNDIYMVVGDSLSNSNNDKTLDSIEKNIISRDEMLRNASNIANFLINTPVFAKNNNLKNKLTLNTFEYSKSNKMNLDFPLINNIRINGKKLENFKPYINIYYLNENIDESTSIEIETNSKNSYKIFKNKKKISVIIANDNEETIYNLITIDKKRNYKSSNFNFKEIAHSNTVLIPNVNNHIIELDIKKTAYRSSNINFNNNEYDILPKGSMLSYSIKVEEYGKYIIQFEITTDDIGLSQIPFITYIDDENKHTLTIGNFFEKTYLISEQIIIDKGLHILSFNFNMTGMHIKKINIIKHP